MNIYLASGLKQLDTFENINYDNLTPEELQEMRKLLTSIRTGLVYAPPCEKKVGHENWQKITDITRKINAAENRLKKLYDQIYGKTQLPPFYGSLKFSNPSQSCYNLLGYYYDWKAPTLISSPSDNLANKIIPDTNQLSSLIQHIKQLEALHNNFYNFQAILSFLRALLPLHFDNYLSYLPLIQSVSDEINSLAIQKNKKAIFEDNGPHQKILHLMEEMLLIIDEQ